MRSIEMAVLLRLCDEDREKFGGPEWIRFDEAALDDLSLTTLNEYETELNISIEFLLRVDKTAKTVRWKAAQAWLGLAMVGEKVPPLRDFDIKVRRVQVKPEESVGDDAVPPDSAPSSAKGPSKKR